MENINNVYWRVEHLVCEELVVSRSPAVVTREYFQDIWNKGKKIIHYLEWKVEEFLFANREVWSPESPQSPDIPSYLLLILLLYFIFIFYLPRCTLPDFPSVYSWLPYQFYLFVIEQQQHLAYSYSIVVIWRTMTYAVCHIWRKRIYGYEVPWKPKNIW